MRRRPSWAPPIPLTELRAASLGQQGVVFEHPSGAYRTTGKNLSSGGMGDVFLMAWADPNTGQLEPVVGKVFHSEYLYQLRTDEVTRADHESVKRTLHEIAAIGHPNILPTLLAEPISDNYLTVTPLKHGTLLEAMHATKPPPPRQRVEVLMQALHGLAKLHEHGFIHRDVTLRNVLVDEHCQQAFLFDFDLTLAQSEIAGCTYKERYKGRIFGSPGYSVPPEILDTALMESSITTKLDVYAVGGALFGLFTDDLPYGNTEDMWALLLRISEGVVFNGNSKIVYPDAVPVPLRKIIEGCLERDPGNRYGSIGLVLADLERVLPELSDGDAAFEGPITTLRYQDQTARVAAVHASRREHSITKGLIEIVDGGLERYGYQVQRAIGRVKGFPIFLATPDPELLAAGRFKDTNTYPKIVTVINLNEHPDGERLVDLWLGGYMPILREARTGLLTSLYRVVHDQWSGFLFLFSEWVDDARFGTDLDGANMSLEEAFGLGYLLARQVNRLHFRGLAHNNVGARSLLLKGVRDRRQAWPAMIGIVAPSLEPDDMVHDVRRLAGLIYSWLTTERIDQAEPTSRGRVDDVRRRLASISFDEQVNQPTIDALMEVLSDGLASVDYNFGVLRANEGDLSAYTLMLIGYSLYARLWQ